MPRNTYNPPPHVAHRPADTSYEPPNLDLVQLVGVGDLKVDAYQRDLVQRRVTNYAARFNAAQVGIIEVSDRDEQLWVVDGQHRVALLMRMFGPDVLVPAIVYRNWSYVQEAERFSYVNRYRTAVTALDTYRADREAGVADVLLIDKLLKRHGLRVASAYTDGVVQSATRLRSCYARYGESLLSSVLSSLKNIWGTERDAYSSDMLGATAWVLHTYAAALDLGIFSDVMTSQYYTAMQLQRRARSRRGEVGGRLSINLAYLMIEAYNSQERRKSNRLPMPADVRPAATKRVNDVARLERLQQAARDKHLNAKHLAAV